jgi:hypothetical protein
VEERGVRHLVGGQPLVGAAAPGESWILVGLRPSGPRVGLQGRILRQDGGLEAAQGRPRFCPELFGQQRPDPASRGECVGLPTGAVERQHQQAPPVLPQGIVRDQPLELRQYFGRPALLEPRLQERSHGSGTHLGQPSPLGLGERRVRPVGVGLAVPQVDGGTQVTLGLPGLARRETGVTAGGEIPDVERVDRRAIEREGVAGAAAHHVPPGRALGPVGLERAAQPHHVRLQRLARGDRRIAVPEDLREGVDAHDSRRTPGEGGEEQAFLGARHGDRPAVVGGHLQRSEDRDAHGSTLDPQVDLQGATGCGP